MKSILLQTFLAGLIVSALALCGPIIAQEENKSDTGPKVRVSAPFQESRKIEISAESTGWNIGKITPKAPVKYPFTPKPITIKLPKNDRPQFQSHDLSFVFSPPECAFGVLAAPKSNATPLYYVDFAGGVARQSVVPGKARVLDVSPNGKFLLIASNLGQNFNDELFFAQIVSIKDGTIDRVLATYAPFYDKEKRKADPDAFEREIRMQENEVSRSSGANRREEIKALNELKQKAAKAKFSQINDGLLEISAGRWIDNESFLLKSPNTDNAILFNARTASVRYRIEVPGYAGVAVSPDRSLLVVTRYDIMTCFDSKTGDRKGYINTGSASDQLGESLVFSADGTKIAAGNDECLNIWDMEKGVLLRSVKLMKDWKKSPTTWIDKRFAIHKSTIIDLKHAVPLWKVMVSNRLSLLAVDASTGAGSWFWYAMFDGESVSVTPDMVVDQKMILESDAAKADESYLLKPGDTVTITVDLPLEDAEKKKVEKYFTDSLAENGYRVLPNGKFRLIVFKKEVDGARNIEYEERHGFERRESSVTVNAYVQRVELLRDNVLIWERTNRIDAPSMLFYQKDGAQKAVDEFMKLSPDWYYGVKLPKDIPDPENVKPRGEAEMTFQNGFRSL